MVAGSPSSEEVTETMEFRITRAELVKALSRIQAIVEKRNTMPILANTLVEAEGEKVFISATDLDVGVRGGYAATVVKKGTITVSARKLFEIARELPDEPLTIRTRENNWVELTCARIVFKLVGLPAEEYPGLPKGEEKNLARIESPALLEMIEKTLYAVSTDDTRYNLNGIYMESDPAEGILRMIATDGHRLAMVDRKPEGVDLGRFESGVIVPRKGILELKRLLEEDDAPVELGFRKGHGVAKKKDLLLVIRLIDAAFPDYKQVIPEGIKHWVTVTRAPLLSALKRISLLAAEKTRSVKLELGSKRLVISSNNPDLGEAREEIEVDYTGEDLAIGFNARYLVEAVGTLDEKEIRLGFRDELSPGRIEPAADGGAVAVVMPMRI
jgi:DNA polymerase-3 subunit beta